MDKIEKLDMRTPDFTDQNIQKIADLFPNCVTESKNGHAIDFDLLKQELSKNIVEGTRERYQLSWPGKAESLVNANTPINKTLRPCREESVDFDNTQNLYIEGDNLEVLKMLQETYLNKIKMIYIDPPYNTGNDFVYDDSFVADKDEFNEASGHKDAEGNRLFSAEKYRKNSSDKGRYHSDWLSMMYARLKLARNLLSDDGLIFISIDDNEVSNLRKLCDEVFGEQNYRNSIVIKRGAKSVQAQFDTWDKLGVGYETILFYSKNSEYRFPKQLKELTEAKGGSWNNHWRGTDRPTMRYELFGITPSSGQWRWGHERSLKAVDNYKKMLSELGKTESEITTDEIDTWYQKREETIDLLRLSKNGKPEHYIPSTATQLKNDVWFDFPANSSRALTSLFGRKIFDNPKPFGLINYCLDFVTDDALVLDFFSGSATTAQVILERNVTSGGKLKFILVQLPEETNDLEFKNICEVGKERIRRAAQKIKEEHPNAHMDLGFRVLKVDESCMKDIYYAPDEIDQASIASLTDNIKSDRSEEDLLFQVMLDWGVDLTFKIERKEIHGQLVFFVNDDDLVACFGDEVTEDLIKELASYEPLRVVLKDSSFNGNDDLKTNTVQIFKQLSEHTQVKVI